MLADAELDPVGLVEMTGYRVGEQNVVGTRLPILEHVEFAVADYSRLTTPPWVDILVQRLKDAAEARVRARVAGMRVRTLDQAVRRITQRVNLFEKILIPTAKKNIQRIRIYLGDAERAAVVTSKLAKVKQQAVEGLPTRRQYEYRTPAASDLCWVDSEKDCLLDDLHARGCLELIPLGSDAKQQADGAAVLRGPRGAEVPACLPATTSTSKRRCAVRRRVGRAASVGNPAEHPGTRVGTRLGLSQRIADAKPWGDFRFCLASEMGELRLWFYVVPHNQMPKVEATGLAWEVVRRDSRFCYVVVLDKAEPQSMPVPRVHVGSR